MPTAEPKGINRRLDFELTDSLVRRFWAGTDKRGENECWLWTGAPRSGYGAIKHQGKVLSTHVLAYRIHHGQIPAGRIVTHDCDNRLCNNPIHLRLGTPTSNIREMYARLPVRVARGELSANAVLTDELVRFILAANVLGAGPRSLATKMGLAYATVCGVVHRKNWKHIAVPDREEAELVVEAFVSKS